MILLIDQVSKNSGEKNSNVSLILREEKYLCDARPDAENESRVKKCWV